MCVVHIFIKLYGHVPEVKNGIFITEGLFSLDVSPCSIQIFLFIPDFSCMDVIQVFIPQFLQLDHSLLSVAPCGPAFLFSISWPPPYSHHPSTQSYCLSGSHGPPTKAVGAWQWNNYGTHLVLIFLTTVMVLFCVSSCGRAGGIEYWGKGEMEAAK